MSGLLESAGSLSLADLFFRATIVLLLSLVLQRLFRGGPAQTRHDLWTLTFAILLVLPAFRLFGLSWDVPIPAGTGEPDYLAATAAESAAPSPVPPAASEAIARPPRWGLARLAFVIWATGCGAALVSVGVGLSRFQKLVRSAEPVGDLAWHRQLDAVQDELGFRSDVRLLLGGEDVTPMAGGLWRPIILLPAAAADWSPARRQMVLAHELVHVRRRDALRQFASRLVLALYWFHPLSWVASHLAAARREEACDEKVLTVGVRPSEYARHLVSLAEGMAPVRAVSALPMAQRSRLESRIRAILGPDRPRYGGALVAVAALIVGMAGGGLALVVDPVRLEIVRYAGSGDADVSKSDDKGAGADEQGCSSASYAGQPCGPLFVPPRHLTDVDQRIAQLKAAVGARGLEALRVPGKRRTFPAETP